MTSKGASLSRSEVENSRSMIKLLPKSSKNCVGGTAIKACKQVKKRKKKSSVPLDTRSSPPSGCRLLPLEARAKSWRCWALPWTVPHYWHTRQSVDHFAWESLQSNDVVSANGHNERKREREKKTTERERRSTDSRTIRRSNEGKVPNINAGITSRKHEGAASENHKTRAVGGKRARRSKRGGQCCEPESVARNVC